MIFGLLLDLLVVRPSAAPSVSDIFVDLEQTLSLKSNIFRFTLLSPPTSLVPRYLYQPATHRAAICS